MPNYLLCTYFSGFVHYHYLLYQLSLPVFFSYYSTAYIVPSDMRKAESARTVAQAKHLKVSTNRPACKLVSRNYTKPTMLIVFCVISNNGTKQHWVLH